MTTHPALGLALGLWLSLTTTCFAQEDTTYWHPASRAPTPPIDRTPPVADLLPTPKLALRVQLQSGGHYSDQDWGLLAGGHAQIRALWFAAGLGASFNSWLVAEHNLALSADAGLSLPINADIRLDVLGTAGIHHYMERDGDTALIVLDRERRFPGVTATLGFVGARLGLHHARPTAIGRVPIRPTFGVVASVEHDLETVTKQGELLSTLDGEQPTGIFYPVDVGTTRVTLVLTGGVTFDL